MFVVLGPVAVAIGAVCGGEECGLMLVYVQGFPLRPFVLFDHLFPLHINCFNYRFASPPLRPSCEVRSFRTRDDPTGLLSRRWGIQPHLSSPAHIISFFISIRQICCGMHQITLLLYGDNEKTIQRIPIGRAWRTGTWVMHLKNYPGIGRIKTSKNIFAFG